MSEPLVSGRAFLGLIRSVKESHGPSALSDALKAMPPATQKAFATRILHAGWYPYPAYVGFLNGLEQKFGRGQPAFFRTLGVASGKRDISTVFRVYLAIASTERLIRGCSKVWAGYYSNAGEMEAVSWAPTDTCLRISGFPEMATAHCRLMEGWMIATMDALGVEVNADAAETACTSRGAPFHEFRCTWKKR